MTAAFEIVVREDEKGKSYWVKAPLGGYMRLSKADAHAALGNGAATLYRPDQDPIQQMKQWLKGSSEG